MEVNAMTKTEIDAEVTRQHAERYPAGCPLLCEECTNRLAGKPTPGPWTVDLPRHAKGRIVTIAANGLDIAVTTNVLPRPTAEANANLIATAPELLAVVRTVAHWQPTIEPEQVATSSLDRAIYAARAAIAKAEGR